MCLTVSFLLTACSNGHSINKSVSTQGQSGNSGSWPNGISPTFIDQKLAQWSTAKAWPFLLSPTFIEASYDNIDKTNITDQVLNEDLSMLFQTEAKAITVDIGFDPWLSSNSAEISKVTHFVNMIKQTGHVLVLKDGSAEYYRHHKLPWTQFENAWVNRVKTIASIFKPAYYTVIKEPPWYAPMIAGLSKDTNSAADQQVLDANNWILLLDRLIAAVKEVSPNTRVGVSVDANVYDNSTGDKFDLAFLQKAVTVPGLSFIGFDIYTANAFTDTQKFLNSVNINNKAVWINEAWSITSSGFANPDQESLDPKWAQMLLEFGRVIHAQGVSPFYTNYFASYENLPTSANLLLQYFKGRTPVFYAFQNYEKSSG